MPKGVSGFRTIFEQSSLRHAKEQLQRVASEFRDAGFDKAADMLNDAMYDILAHMHFPRSYWKRIRFTNPLKHLNKEIKQRFNVVRIFPNQDGRSAAIRATGRWITGR